MACFKKDNSSRNWRNNLFTLLCRWNGSLYKLCYKEIVLFVILFDVLSIIYRCLLDDDQKSVFKHWVRYCDVYLEKLPISWIIGFYMTTVAGRWWQQCVTLPTPDRWERLLLTIAVYIPGDDIESHIMRKSLCQSCTLMIVLLLRKISDSVGSRLKTLQHVVDAGFLTREQKELYETAEASNPGVNLYWLPGLWFCHNLREAQSRGKIASHDGIRLITAEFLSIRSKCETLCSYHWVRIPIVYTQVVTIATYSFFSASVFGRQYTGDGIEEISIDMVFPSWSILENLFYIGLLKVANHMVNPNGNDDEAFDLNSFLNRHTQVVHLGTHALWQCRPQMDPSILLLPAAIAQECEKKMYPATSFTCSILIDGYQQETKESQFIPPKLPAVYPINDESPPPPYPVAKYGQFNGPIHCATEKV